MSVIIRKKEDTYRVSAVFTCCSFLASNVNLQESSQEDFFKTWPVLTPEVLKHLPKSLSTVQGHLHQERQNLQSTRQQPSRHTNLEAIQAHYAKLKKIKN